jgi:hypothetical protein
MVLKSPSLPCTEVKCAERNRIVGMPTPSVLFIPLEVMMVEFMKGFKDVGLVIASGIVGIGLLALFAQITLLGLFLVRRLRAMHRRLVKIEVLPAPEIKYLPRG